jgi:O-antigen/teichoic acid export membrane protein
MNKFIFSSIFAELAQSRGLRQSASNSFYNVADSVLFPLLILLVTPFFVSRLGLQAYGIWMLVLALAGLMGLFNVGLGDTIIRHVSLHRQGGTEAVESVVRTCFAHSMLLGSLLAVVLWLLAGILVDHAFRIEPVNRQLTIRAIQLGGTLLAMRTLESIPVSVLRAYERYDVAAKISMLIRIATVGLAVGIADLGGNVVHILAGTVVLTAVGFAAAACAARHVTGIGLLLPKLKGGMGSELLQFGLYSSVQGGASLLLIHADRLLISAMLGMSALAAYTICLQLAQQIHSLMVPAFAFLFPWVSARSQEGVTPAFRRLLRWAAIANVLGALLLAVPLYSWASEILRIWMGVEFSLHHSGLFRLLVVAFFILSLNTATYFVLMGLGKVKLVAMTSLCGTAVTLAVAFALIPWMGAPGAAVGRVVFALITGWIMTRYLFHLLGFTECLTSAKSPVS